MNKELPNNIDISQKEIFEWLTQQIRLARKSVFEMANRTLVDLYWQIGKLISEKVKTEGWGKGIVSQLATYIATELPEAKGFSDKNLWRMKQFYELYNSNEKLSPMVRELSWTHNITIMSRCKSDEERLFYLQMCKNNGLTKRELERQIDTAQYERSLTSAKLSPMVSSCPKRRHMANNTLFQRQGNCHQQRDVYRLSESAGGDALWAIRELFSCTTGTWCSESHNDSGGIICISESRLNQVIWRFA